MRSTPTWRETAVFCGRSTSYATAPGRPPPCGRAIETQRSLPSRRRAEAPRSSRLSSILQTFPSDFIAGRSAERHHVFIEASRLAQADQAGGTAAGPPGFNRANHDPAHAYERAALITPGRAIPESELGPAASSSVLGEHTTHISVVDRDGNLVSLTQTLCRQYGSKVATPGLGFPYNSCLEFLDFENPQSPIYLRPGGTYPTNMAPTIVRWDDSAMALGSAGSDRIPPSLCEVITNVIDRKTGLRDAVVAPRVIWNSAHDPGRVCIEVADPIVEADAESIRGMGFETMYASNTLPTPCPTPPSSAGSTPSPTTPAAANSSASETRAGTASQLGQGWR